MGRATDAASGDEGETSDALFPEAVFVAGDKQECAEVEAEREKEFEAGEAGWEIPPGSDGFRAGGRPLHLMDTLSQSRQRLNRIISMMSERALLAPGVGDKGWVTGGLRFPVGSSGGKRRQVLAAAAQAAAVAAAPVRRTRDVARHARHQVSELALRHRDSTVRLARRTVTGREDLRVRDFVQLPRVVRRMDKYSFTLGVLGISVTEYVMLRHPDCFAW